MSEKIKDIVHKLAEPITEEMDFELIDVEFVKEGAGWYLRLYIDKEGGVDLDDCQAVSNKVSDLLDKEDPIPQSYFLEVSSPGIERILKTDEDFIKYRGSEVKIRTYNSLHGKKEFIGTLGSVQEDVLLLSEKDGSEIKIPRTQISQVRLSWEGIGGKEKNEY